MTKDEINSSTKEQQMNIDQAINAANEAEEEGLMGLYPTACYELRNEVFALRHALRHAYSGFLITQNAQDYLENHWSKQAEKLLPEPKNLSYLDY
jgi:hypothetical protein